MIYVESQIMVTRVTISFTDDIGDFVNKLAAERNVSRSQLFAQLIEEERRRMLEAKLAEGYIALADECRRFAEETVDLAAEVWPPY
jgi:predicted transcriptional regulator